MLIDHQPYQFANLNSHEPTMIVNNVIGLAKTAKVFNVPTILTTVLERRGGYLIRSNSREYPATRWANSGMGRGKSWCHPPTSPPGRLFFLTPDLRRLVPFSILQDA